jgi:hypothetical protein
MCFEEREDNEKRGLFINGIEFCILLNRDHIKTKTKKY